MNLRPTSCGNSPHPAKATLSPHPMRGEGSVRGFITGIYSGNGSNTKKRPGAISVFFGFRNELLSLHVIELRSGRRLAERAGAVAGGGPVDRCRAQARRVF